MNELIDIKPDVNVKESEYKRLLGFPSNYKLEGRAKELAAWARNWFNENGKPWVYAIQKKQLDISNDNLKICNIKLSSKRLRKQFTEAGVHGVMLVAVSAGKECEEKSQQLWLERKPDEYFFLEVYGSAVVEHLITTTGFYFCDWAERNGMAILPHYSPGYPGWKIEDQNKILEIIELDKLHDLPGEICVFDTGMVKPKKSMLAIFGITKQLDKVQNFRELNPCKSCSLLSCQYRRIPYSNPKVQIEDIHKLQANRNELSYEKDYSKTALTESANYSISLKALQKWSEERLQLNILSDDSIEARFRYEGTTCSNMGIKLEFDYKIELSSKTDGYKIINLDCNPIAGDDGYKYMCEFIKDPEELMKKIYNEKPLLGKQLNDVLNWEHQFSPEGCYCKVESRNHKWGLVFEVLHYALVNKEIEV